MLSEKVAKSTCSYCGVGCGILVKTDKHGRLQVEGDPEHPVNRGMLCSKGMNLHHVVQDKSDRLLYPTMRWSRNHPAERVSWDTALDRAAAVFGAIIEKHGPQSVGFYVSGQCLTEEYYLANKLVKGFIGCNNIDTNSRLCMSSAVAGHKMAFGEDSVPIAYADIEKADCFMISGANPAWCHPILFRRIEQHMADNPKAKMIVVDPRKTATTAQADLHLQINPGTDVVLFNAIAKRLIEKNLIDKKFLRNSVTGFEQLKAQVMKVNLRKAAQTCGIGLDQIKKAAQMIGHSMNFLSMWTMGLNQSVIGVDKNIALLNISILTGQIGRPGAGPFSLTGQPNAMGGREVGGMANLLAVHKNLNDPQHRKEVQSYWGSKPISEQPGLTATEMFKAMESGKLKAIWIICTNPAVSMPNLNLVEKALEKAKFVVVQDISNKSDTLRFADLILPAAGWLEKEGTMTNSERRVSYLPKVIDAPGEALPDAEILIKFAQKMGYPGFNFESVAEVFEEYARMTKGTNIDISGLSHERLINEGSMQWPVPDILSKGTSRLFEDQLFYTEDHKAHLHLPKKQENQSEKIDQNYPLVLTTGRIRDQWHTMTRTGKVNKLSSHIAKPFLSMNRVDAFERGIKEGDMVVVKSRRGQARLKARVDYDIKRGLVFTPMHWGRLNEDSSVRANNLTNDLVDPISKEPDFKYAAIQVEKYVKKTERLVVIGAGAAAYRFVQEYRKKNNTDDIAVFSLEEKPFYNRVLLPEYVSDHLSWAELEKIKQEEIEKLNIDLYGANPIVKILDHNKEVMDANGRIYAYDKLILATGSRAFVPPNAKLDQKGRFTLRSKGDADRLKKHLRETGLPTEQQHVIIVGGGLLGLELAATLNQIGTQISIVQRASRLMERQLDLTASKILAEDVRDRGIDVYFDNEVSTVFDSPSSSGQLEVTLKSGKLLEGHAIVYAIGTSPNIELARDIGLDVQRGVLVDQYLRSSDPCIFALGEIAQFEGRLYGITSAAEQQACLAVKYIQGDTSSLYKGSVLMNILKFEDLDLCSIGQVQVDKEDESIEEIVFQDLSKKYYKKCLIKNDHLIGAILIGDKNEFAEFKTLIEDQIELGDIRETLLRSGSVKEPTKGALVCSCAQVGEGNLNEKIQEGCLEFNTLCKETGAGLGCGSCKPEIQEILNKRSTAKAMA